MTSDIELVEECVDRMISTDAEMTRIEAKIRDEQSRIDNGDEWEGIEAERKIVEWHLALGQASTKFLIEMNGAIFYAERMIDEWKDTEVMKIGRKYSIDAAFYRRAEQEWPEVAKRNAWQVLRSGGVPF